MARLIVGLLGPHFFYDLVRLARCSRTRDLRILYGLALLFGLGMIYWFQFPRESLGNLLFNPERRMSINEAANFATIFVFTVIVVQNLTVLLLTPVYVGSAIAEEKEHKTLDLLFATQMKDREIILGKMFSRMTHLGAILLGGLPVLSMAQLWGGIDFPILLANFVNTGLLLLSVGGISILVSTLCRKVVTAVMVIYGFVLPVAMCLGLFSLGGKTSLLGLAQSDLGPNPEMIPMVLGGLAAFHGMIAIACVSVALVVMRGQHGGDDYANTLDPNQIRNLERRRRRAHSLGKEDQEPRPPRGFDPSTLSLEPLSRSVKIDRLYDLPPIHDDPLLWKEMNVGFNRQVVWPLFHTFLGLSLALLLMVFLSMLLGPDLNRQWTERIHDIAGLVKVLCILWALFCCVLVAYSTSSSIVRERQQGTLDALLTLPVNRLDILRAKWLGCFYRGRLWWFGLAAVIAVSTLLTAIQIVGGILFLVAVFIHGAFLCSLGLFLSVVSKTVLSAHAKMALILMFLLFGTVLFSEVMAISLTGGIGEILRVGLNPVRTWWTLTFSWQDYLDRSWNLDGRIASALLGLALYGLLAVVFWFLARWRFRPVE